MGHIRLGRIPKTKPWKVIFEILSKEDFSSKELASAVANSISEKIPDFKNDKGLNYCFWILARIMTASRTENFSEELDKLNISTSENISGLSFLRNVSNAIENELSDRSQNTIFMRIADLSLRRTLTNKIIDQSETLFGTNLADIQSACRALSTRNSFGIVAREFFSNFLSQSIKFIADKEISNYVSPQNSVSSPEEVLEFHRSIDRFCMESSKIIEDFAGGWFSKNNWESENNISENATAGFTAYAIEKIQMELGESLP